MRTIVISECENAPRLNALTLNLGESPVRDCTGCWTCWWKTPGKCAFRDLDDFYHEYITADRVVVFAKVTKGFVSGKLKTLFDRMLPLYLPYVSYATGESMHVPRYEKYPRIDFYYQGTFETPNGRRVFEDYVRRVLYQFHIRDYSVKPIEDFEGGEGI